MKMINKKIFNEIQKQLEESDENREDVIKKSRDVLKLSKQAIYCAHREDLKKAKQLLKQANSVIKTLKKANKEYFLWSIGIYSCGMQEYVEAATYLSFVAKDNFPTPKTLGATNEDYLMGLADLTGELCRRAVMLATKKDKKEVAKIYKLVDDIHGEFLKFHFRNGELRKKSDSIKWNLKKIEEVIYDLK